MTSVIPCGQHLLLCVEEGRLFAVVEVIEALTILAKLSKIVAKHSQHDVASGHQQCLVSSNNAIIDLEDDV